MAKQTFTTGQVLTAAQMTSLQQTAMLGGDTTAKTTSYVLVAADAGTVVAMNSSGSTTITVNTGLFSAGDIVTIQNRGSGTCTVTAGTATVNTSGSLVLAQYQGGVLYFNSASAAVFYQFATPASGDIEGVTAGTGISGGGTSGTVTITNSMATAIDAKGDLIVGTGADTFARLAVGTNGHTLVADSSETTGVKWAAPSSSGVNKNYLVNGGFAIGQRGTSFTASNNNDDAYTLDRWYILSDTNDVVDVTQETSVVPTNGQFAIALDVETVNKKFGIATILENKDCIGLIGNTVTFSFKAKVSSTTKLDNVKAAIVAWSGTADTVTSDIVSAWNSEGTNPTLIANATYENTPVNLNLTTSYATYSVSAAVDTANTKNIILFIWSDVTDTTLGDFLYIAEAKLELGSIATSFVYAGGTIQGELAACQRYYYRISTDTAYNLFAAGNASSSTQAYIQLIHPVALRVKASSLEYSNLAIAFVGGATNAVTNLVLDGASASTLRQNLTATVASGLTTNEYYTLIGNNSTSAYLGISAEL